MTGDLRQKDCYQKEPFPVEGSADDGGTRVRARLASGHPPHVGLGTFQDNAVQPQELLKLLHIREENVTEFEANGGIIAADEFSNLAEVEPGTARPDYLVIQGRNFFLA
ncbi:MAG: hypothetical protein N2689_11520 [Verrucomicrobiae bacterium]|nr:hypothetical protein [Verrucomicrobiae bacterium]